MVGKLYTIVSGSIFAFKFQKKIIIRVFEVLCKDVLVIT